MTRCSPYREGVRLSTTYRTVAGDTFDIIAQKLYGFETEGGRIAEANPGAFQPLAPRTSLVIPTLPGALINSPQQSPSSDPDETALTIESTRFRFWTEIQITQQTDKVSTVAFFAPFDPESLEQRERFRPMSFKDIAVSIGGSQVLTGTMLVPLPVATAASTAVSVNGYGLPGVLNDCTLPNSAFPKEFLDQNMQQIAEAMAKPFGIGVVFEAEAGAIFAEVRPKPSDKVLPFLVTLARQRNLVIGDNARGELVFRQSVTPGSPVANLTSVLNITPSYGAQKYYSHVTGIEVIVPGIEGASFTVKNPRLLDKVRPFTFELPDTEGAGIETAVRAKAGRMFADTIAYTVELSTWRDDRGALWRANTTVTLLAPSAAIYTKYEFEIRRVVFTRTAATKTAVLELVIPRGFSGVLPEILPWDN